MATLADMIGAARSGPVQRSTASFGGHCTYAFTQCKPPISTFLAQDESTAIGVCEALAAHWIKYHAEGGSMWNWLIVDGQVSMTKLLFEVMQLQSKGILGDQEAVTQAWLRKSGIAPVQGSMVLNRSRQMGARFIPFEGGQGRHVTEGRTGLLSCGDLARSLVRDNTGGAGCYKKLYLSGKFGAHAMALWVAQDIVFFDPNFGEFWFPNRSAFFNWFTQKFWSSSLYSVGLSGEFEISPYAKQHWRGQRRG